MYSMRISDFRALNESVLILGSTSSPEDTPKALEAALSVLIPSDLAAVECFNSQMIWKGRLLGDSEGLIERHFPAFLEHCLSHPLFPAFTSGRLSQSSLRISDVISQTNLQHSGIFADFLKPIGVDRQMAVALRLNDGSAEVTVLSRKGTDFSSSEKERMSAFLPHLRRSRLRSTSTFPHSAVGRQPSTAAAENITAIAHLRRDLGLTRRELEIVWWLTRGKADKDMSYILEISERTVQKHCENIYRKMGVDGRTAAVVKALDKF